MESNKAIIGCAKRILTDCLKMSPNEKVLLVFDKFGFPIADAFAKAAIELNCDTCLRYISYEEQEKSSMSNTYLNKIRGCIACSDAIIFSGNDSDVCTRFRVKILGVAVANNSKIIHMPGVSDIIFVESTYKLNFNNLHKLCESIEKELKNKKYIEIISESYEGKKHKLKLAINDREIHVCGGIAKPGEIMNIPTGEVYVAPLEDSAEGSLVLNGSGPDCVFHEQDEVILNFKSGILDIDKIIYSKGLNSKRLKKDIIIPAKKEGIENITLGEFGIGMNSSVEELIGNEILDEKMAGTAHIAIGANTPFGGKNDAQFHHDLIFKPININVDNRTLKIKWKV